MNGPVTEVHLTDHDADETTAVCVRQLDLLKRIHGDASVRLMLAVCAGEMCHRDGADSTAAALHRVIAALPGRAH